jgi:hypothetical protein
MAADEDVPLGDAARHYEQQFGDKIRQVQKGGARPPAGAPRGGGWGAGRGAVGAVLVVVFIVIRLLVSIGNSSNRHPTPSYTFTPPPAMPPVDFERVQREMEQRRSRWRPVAPALDNGPSYRFEEGDVLLPEGLCYRVAQEARGAASTPGKRLAAFLDAAARDLVGRAARGERLGAVEEADLRAALNEVLDKRDFYDEPSFRGLDLPAEAQAVAAKRDQAAAAELRKLNRLALEAAYPRQIVRAQFRGALDPGIERELALSDLRKARQKYEPAKP